jgi:ABC-type Mn2+/Zn2+ transport system ATPase subunit
MYRKSTLMHSLRGTLPLLKGKRTENELLRLGVFTQDLAQELNPRARAVDLVTAYAREGPFGDINISDKDARGAMGRLGLQGEKALREIRNLSGGEKARVALAMFSLKPSNLYLLDEASNHLDTECVEALSEALSTWGDDKGAIVVISHDQSFCERIEFTHVMTVQDGYMKMEQRNARSDDWEIEHLSAQVDAMAGASEGAIHSISVTNMKTIDPKLRKKAHNAPKRISKLEEMIDDAEKKMAKIDSEMLANGSNVTKLMELSKQKEKLEASVAKHMQEMEELESVLSMVA